MYTYIYIYALSIYKHCTCFCTYILACIVCQKCMFVCAYACMYVCTHTQLLCACTPTNVLINCKLSLKNLKLPDTRSPHPRSLALGPLTLGPGPKSQVQVARART